LGQLTNNTVTIERLFVEPITPIALTDRMQMVKPTEIPQDFPHSATTAVVGGAQPKLCVRLVDGKYVSDQTDTERWERWDICEDLAHQLIAKARKDAEGHPEHDADTTLERVRVAVARKKWVSEGELGWLISRLRTLLGW
jgi:hypothetical protein